MESARTAGMNGQQNNSEGHSKRRPGESGLFGADGLIRQLMDNVTTLASKEIALAMVEVNAALKDVKIGITSTISSGLVLFLGAFYLLAALVIWLTKFMALWASCLLVGGVITLIGLILMRMGTRRLKRDSLSPQHTVSNVRKDTEVIKDTFSGDKS